jgi:hypothetical protein
MTAMKNEIIQGNGEKMGESNEKFKDTLNSILGIVQGLAGNRN